MKKSPKPRGPFEVEEAGCPGPGWCSRRVLRDGMSPSDVVCEAGSWRMRLAANGVCAAKVNMANQQALDAWTSCTSNNNKLHGREKQSIQIAGKNPVDEK